ncbi:MAG: PhoH family protein [Elusimicrobiota bacterium]
MSREIYQQKISFKSSQKALEAFGEYDKNLKKLENEFDVQIYARGTKAVIKGKKKAVKKVLSKLKKGEDRQSKTEFSGTTYIKTFSGKPIKPLGAKQKKYIRAMKEKDLVVAIGPAGTGKTFLACARAVKALQTRKVDRIVLTRPVVEAGEKLGYLPGDFQEKVDPYLRPLYDAFYTLIGPSKFQSYREDDIIEIVPLAYMRGRTLDDAMIVLDEAQNTSSGQMEMFLTRIGFNSQAVVTGDITQVDLEKSKVSGLIEVQEVIRDLEAVEFLYFTHEDVVRHHLVKKIINAYNEFKKNKDNWKK